jgi:hypothetical protein
MSRKRSAVLVLLLGAAFLCMFQEKADSLQPLRLKLQQAPTRIVQLPDSEATIGAIQKQEVYVPDEVLVSLSPAASLEQLARSFGVSVREPVGPAGVAA